MAKVLIIGASRGVGLETVKRALEAGHDVRAFARSADRIGLVHERLEKVRGDALAPRDVEAALAGVDAVVQTLGVSPSPRLLVKRVRLFSDATRVLVEAMERSGVRRLVCLTGFGAGDSRNQGGLLYDTAFNLFLGRVYDDKNLQEYLIRNSDLDWTIVRPVILTNGRWTGHYRVLLDPRDWGFGFVSRADVADFLVQQIDSDAYLRKTPVLMG
ncbi:MAG: NAD(P)-dependent oxidoreductase [Pseudomonadota bacterium]